LGRRGKREGKGMGREREEEGQGKGRGREGDENGMGGEGEGRDWKGFAGPMSNCFLRTSVLSNRPTMGQHRTGDGVQRL